MKKINLKKLVIGLGLFILIAISIWSLILAYYSINEAKEASTIAKEASTIAKEASTIAKEIKEQQIDLPSIIDYWKPQIARIVCSDQDKSSSGSGVIFLCLKWNPKSGFVAITNKHLIINAEFEFYAEFCKVELGKDVYEISGNRIMLFEEHDIALISIDDPTEDTKKAAFSSYEDAKYCKKEIGKMGDEVLIIGYPGIGTKGDITATKGIISGYEEITIPGFEGHYYVTDAKIDRGNSGGAAILLKHNCHLGIPTFVEPGKLESLGRILDFMEILLP